MAKKETELEINGVDTTDMVPQEGQHVNPHEETTELVTSGGNDVSLYDEDNALDAFDDDDVVEVPQLVVVQSSHDYNEHEGNLYSIEEEEPIEKMKAVLLILHDARTMFPEKYKKGQMPLCLSNDGRTPFTGLKDADDNPIAPMNDTCGYNPKTRRYSCPYAQWNKKEPSPCGYQRIIYLLDVENEGAYRMRIASTALSPFNKFIKTLGHKKSKQTRALKKKIRELRKAGKPLTDCFEKAQNFMFTFDLSVNPVQRDGDSGKSWLPMFENIELVEDEELILDYRDVAEQAAEYALHRMNSVGYEDNNDGSGGGSGSSKTSDTQEEAFAETADDEEF